MTPGALPSRGQCVLTAVRREDAITCCIEGAYLYRGALRLVWKVKTVPSFAT